MMVIGADGRPHPCRHTLSDKIAPAWIRGGAIVDRADEPTRQSRLQKQIRIGSTDPPRSFVGSSLAEAIHTEVKAALALEQLPPELDLAKLRELMPRRGSQTQLLIEDDAL